MPFTRPTCTLIKKSIVPCMYNTLCVYQRGTYCMCAASLKCAALPWYIRYACTVKTD